MFKFEKGESNDWCNDEKVGLFYDKDLKKAYFEDVEFAKDEKITLNVHVEDNGEVIADLSLQTNNVMNEFTLYLGRETKGGVKASVELVFTVEEIIEANGLLDRVNYAPIFINV